MVSESERREMNDDCRNDRERETVSQDNEIDKIKTEMEEGFRYLQDRIGEEGGAYEIVDDSMTYEEMKKEIEDQEEADEKAKKAKDADEAAKDKAREERNKGVVRQRGPLGTPLHWLKSRKEAVAFKVDAIKRKMKVFNPNALLDAYDEVRSTHDLFGLREARQIIREEGLGGLRGAISAIRDNMGDSVKKATESAKVLLAEESIPKKEVQDDNLLRLEEEIRHNRAKIKQFRTQERRFSKPYQSAKKAKISDKINRLGLKIEAAERAIKKIKNADETVKSKITLERASGLKRTQDFYMGNVERYEVGIREIDGEIADLEADGAYSNQGEIQKLLKEREKLVKLIKGEKKRMFARVQNPTRKVKGINYLDVRRHRNKMDEIAEKKKTRRKTWNEGVKEEAKKEKEEKSNERRADLVGRMTTNLTKVIESGNINTMGVKHLIVFLLTGSEDGVDDTYRQLKTKLPGLESIKEKLNNRENLRGFSGDNWIREIFPMFVMSDDIDIDELFESVESLTKEDDGKEK